MLVLLTGATGVRGAHPATLLPAQGRRPSAGPRRRFLRAAFGHDSEKSIRLARLTGADAVIDAVGIMAARSAA